MVKTNAMRLLEKEKISFEAVEYEYAEDDLSGIHAAEALGMPVEQTFKTLLTRGDKTGLLVFCIPVHLELDLKKAATLSGNKKVEMTPVKELLSLTGYLRGGCSPIGMKKRYPCLIQSSAISFETIGISAGIRGQQLLVEPKALIAYLAAQMVDVVK